MWRDSQRAWVKGFVERLVSDGQITDTHTALFERSLAKILATPYDRRYPALKALEMMQIPEPVEVGAASVISRGHEIRGEATLTSNYQTEVSRVEVVGREHELTMFGILSSFFIAYQQIQHAAFARVPLQTWLAKACYRVVAEGMDLTLSLGSDSAGVTGMINNANVPVVQGGVGVYHGDWAAVGTTDAEILADVEAAVGAVETGSLYTPNVLAVGPLEYNRFIRPQTLAAFAPNLKSHVEAAFSLKVMKWERLREIPAAYAAGGVAVARAVLYENELEIFNPLVTAAPEQYPPRQQLVGYEVAVHQRCGGVESMNPLGALYFDMG
jgi:hypothetical protein